MRIEKTVTITITVEETAAAFCEMSSAEQARFFNIVAGIAKTWGAPFANQMQHVTDDIHLTPEGRCVMQIIGEYSKQI